ncbi:carboxylesterase [Lewinella sp. JB7]|uniref:alpha/beta hydrolase n=1 Tax=Lewinella sp. JB7 TaxID=2962887 RepID=UPI0020C95388|nr:alpha/beta hydrolase [Lewinella sp. JB7]MCP9236148.1 alpha/beta hydrolase [Lewinella sp. JB7]
MRKMLYIAVGFIVIMVVTYLLGPEIDQPVYVPAVPEVPTAAAVLTEYLARKESAAPTRPNNEARIVWHDSTRSPTEYAFVYLHGFGGSYRDGYPVNVNVPAIFGANAFLGRWSGHGLTAEAALRDFTPESAWADALEALAIGEAIGRKVILMSTSTGGTLALKLAAEFPDRVHALLNMGPNVEDDQPGASLLMSPWGHELAYLASFGSNKKISHEEPGAAQYFDTVYPSEALVELQVLVQTTMTPETFSRITCPVLTIFYKENFLVKDEHVEVSSYPDVHDQFATPADRKRLLPLPTPKSHFVGSQIKSEDWMAAQRAIVEFCRDVLDMHPLHPVDHVSDTAGLE